MKTFHFTMFIKGKQEHCSCNCKSMKILSRITNISYNHLREYASVGMFVEQLEENQIYIKLHNQYTKCN